MTFQWNAGQSPSQVFGAGVERFVKMLDNGIILVFELYAPQIEGDMKEDAPWDDRTGNARQTLKCFWYQVEDGVLALVAKQQMDYGVWLELKNGGRFAIVLPTLEQYYGQVWNDIRGLVE